MTALLLRALYSHSSAESLLVRLCIYTACASRMYSQMFPPAVCGVLDLERSLLLLLLLLLLPLKLVV
jgi:hypothetical protein